MNLKHQSRLSQLLPRRHRPLLLRTPQRLTRKLTFPPNGTPCWKILIQRNPRKRRPRQGPLHPLLRLLTKLPRSLSPTKSFRLQKSQLPLRQLPPQLPRPTRSRNSNCLWKNPRLSNKNQIPLRTFPRSFLRSTSRKTSLHRPKRATRPRYRRSRPFPKSPSFLKNR